MLSVQMSDPSVMSKIITFNRFVDRAAFLFIVHLHRFYLGDNSGVSLDNVYREPFTMYEE